MKKDTHVPDVVKEVVATWSLFVDSIDDWCSITKGVKPKDTDYGPIYELHSLPGRFNESFAIADMRGIMFAQPHYHINDEVEIYFVLEGSGRIVVGEKIRIVKKGDVVVTPSNTAHYTIPRRGLVLAVVNTPPFNPENIINLTSSNLKVSYSHEQFKALVQEERSKKGH